MRPRTWIREMRQLLPPLLLCALAACGGTAAGPDDHTGLPADVGYLPAEAGAVSCAYRSSPPVRVDGVHATAQKPLIVSGLEISSSQGTCIDVRDARHVVIRDNYLHHCDAPGATEALFNGREGYAVLVGKSSDVVIMNNIVEECAMGIGVYSTTRLTVTHNTIFGTTGRNSLRLERVTDAEVAANRLTDNGIPETFWAPGHRDIGIHVVRSDGIAVRDNVVLRSSSDGIAVSGQIDGGGLTTQESDWSGTAKHIRIHNNLLLDNMELGIWLTRARDVDIHHNTIRTGCFTYGTGIGFSFDIDASEVHRNEIVTCLVPAFIGLSGSHDNYIHDNVHYAVTRGDHAPVEAHDDPSSNRTKAQWSGIPDRPSSGNRITGNVFFQIGGALGAAIQQKVRLAEREETFEARGWFACEVSEGELDEECVAAQAALGNQGVPRDYLVFDPLMADPKPYVVSESK